MTDGRRNDQGAEAPHQVGRTGDQPVGGQGFVVIRHALEIRIKIVTALQHLQGDVRPAGFRAPQVARAQAGEQQQGRDAQ